MTISKMYGTAVFFQNQKNIFFLENTIDIRPLFRYNIDKAWYTPNDFKKIKTYTIT